MPKKETQSPLNERHLTILNETLALSNQAHDLLASCEECGLNVTKEKEEVSKQRQLAANLKAKFFPKAK